MAYYLFPKANESKIQFQFQFQIQNQEKNENEKDTHHLSPSLTRYLYELFEIIQTNPKEYEHIQRELHPYYHGILANGPDDSYYEITEIMYTMRINAYLDYYVSKNIQILNLGSNSNAILQTRKYLGRNDINNCDISLFPSYHSWMCTNLFHKMHIIFADFIEMDTVKMLIRLCTILSYQSKNGVVLWKIGDCFTPFMLDIIYYLSSFYHKTYFIKPIVMDTSKSEKYLVCKGFCPPNNYMNTVMSLYTSAKTPIYRFLSTPIPFYFLNKLEEINYIFGQVQLEQIHAILLMIGHKFKQDKIQYNAKIHLQKSAEWINKHKLPFFGNHTSIA